MSATEHDIATYGKNRDDWQDEFQQCKSGLCLSVVVFGATGDLAAKKTFKSLETLWKRGFIPQDFHMIGFGRSSYTDDSLRDKIKGHLETDKKDEFLKKLSYQKGESYDDADSYKKLQQTMAKIEGDCACDTGGRLFYLAVPPSSYAQICAMIKEQCSDLMIKGTDEKPSWVRIIIEKPFGKDLQSAKELSDSIAEHFTEDHIYRIDHYLGKELSQNMLVMRFSNQFMSALWDNKNIANIQISMKEDFGTEGRGGFYDDQGVIRDVMQNHLLQILALLLMERPVSMHPDDIRDEKTKLVRSLRTIEQNDVVVGQYTAAGDKPGYTDDEGVPNDSITPTYAAIRLWCDNERWEGVPIIMKAGKAMDKSKTDIRLQFKTQAGFFGENGGTGDGFRNEFVIQLKPRNAMYIKFVVKKPGLEMDAIMSELNLTYNQRFTDWVPEAYERLILDCMNGNQQHFVRRDELRASWAIFTPILHALDAGKGPELHKYKYGDRGLDAADQLVKDSGYVQSAKYSWRSESADGSN